MEVRKVAEIATWVGLFLLIPGTALGYFSEGSLPGQPLYPLKRGIENVALSAQSFNNQAKALYEVELTNRRLAESTKLLASNEPVYNFEDVYTQIAAARASISTISDVTERKQAEQKLEDTITLYQNQLMTLQANAPKNTTFPFLSPTPVNHTNTISTPTPTPASNNTMTNSTSTQITDFNTQLQQIKDNLTTDVNVQTTPAPTSTPTPTQAPPTPTPTTAPHTPVFTYPQNGQTFQKGEWIRVTVAVLNGTSKDVLKVFVDEQTLCTGSYSAFCYWQVPSHYATGKSSFTLTAQDVDALGRYSTTSVTVYLENGNH